MRVRRPDANTLPISFSFLLHEHTDFSNRLDTITRRQVRWIPFVVYLTYYTVALSLFNNVLTPVSFLQSIHFHGYYFFRTKEHLFRSHSLKQWILCRLGTWWNSRLLKISPSIRIEYYLNWESYICCTYLFIRVWSLLSHSLHITRLVILRCNRGKCSLL